MKRTQKHWIVALTLASTLFGCNGLKTEEIVYVNTNKEFVFVRNVDELRRSDDVISQHIDSILSGLIDTEFVSTGSKEFNLNNDTLFDVSFEIVDLNRFNPRGLPESFDTLAARVFAYSTLNFLDNTTYGYPNALNDGEEISKKGNWVSGNGVLGTFANAGQFQGEGEKYLAIRLVSGNECRYGWIKIYCSQHSDTLRIIEYAYNNIPGGTILAGQKE